MVVSPIQFFFIIVYFNAEMKLKKKHFQCGFSIDNYNMSQRKQVGGLR